MKTTRLKVVLAEVEPPVVRVIDAPSLSPLPELHELLQPAMGRTDSHLHQFLTDNGATYGTVLPDDLDVWPDQRDETHARLTDLGVSFTYLYDFGDNWTHEVSVLGAGAAAPAACMGRAPARSRTSAGRPATPSDALADPGHQEHQRIWQWTGNRLRPFDRAVTDRWVRRVVGEVPETARLLLELTAGRGAADPPRTTSTDGRARAATTAPALASDRSPAATQDDLWPLSGRHQGSTRAEL